jgi:hypothetical protein
MGVEDDPRPRIDMVGRERQHCAAGSGIAAQPGDDETRHGVADLEDQIVDRIDVPLGFRGRSGAGLDRKPGIGELAADARLDEAGHV